MPSWQSILNTGTYRMKRIFLSLILISIISMIPFLETFSMVRSDSLDAYKLYNKAGEFWRDMQYDSSNYYYNKAAAIFLKNKNWTNYIECQQKMSINFRYLENYSASLEHLNKGLYAAGNLVEDKDSLKAELFGNTGSIYYDMGYYHKAYRSFKDMLDINMKIFGTYHPNTGKGYQNIGLIFYRTGKYNKALENFKKALSIWDSTVSKDNPLLANGYTYTSKIYLLKGEYSKSIEYEEKAIKIWVGKLGEGHPYIAESYQNLANMYSYSGNYNKALEYDYKAMQIRRDFAGEESRQVAESYAHIGNVFLKMENLTNSKFFLDKSIAVYHKANPSDPGLADAYIYSGNLSKKRQDYNTAVAYYDSALQIVRPKYNPLNTDPENPAIIPYENQYLTALIEKANTIYSMTDNSVDSLLLTQSLVSYNTASVLLQKLKTGFRGNEQELILIKRFHEVNKKGILTALKLYGQDKNTEYIDSAFLFSERDKAGTREESMVSSGAVKYSGVPDSLINNEKELKADLYFFGTKLKDAEESGNMKAAGDSRYRILNSQRKFNALLNYTKDNFPSYYRIKYPEQLNSTYEIRKLLPPDAAILEYFSGDTTITIFALTNNTINAVTVSCDPDFFDDVKRLREALPEKNYIKYLSSASELYSKLIDPVVNFIRDKKKLYIIPDYTLAYLPFEALLTRPITGPFNGNFIPLPYLINYYTITYNYSAELLRESLLSEKNHTDISFAGFASLIPFGMTPDKIYKAIGQDESLNDTELSDTSLLIKDMTFKETETEVKSIAGLFNQHSYRSDIFDDRASVVAFLNSDTTVNYKFIQLSIPAFINDEHPDKSALVFYYSKYDTAKIGIISAGGLYNLNLDADLTVLSASETIPGKDASGKGIFSITNALHYAGTDNIIISFWLAADKSTTLLMNNFYANILEGMDYASSLRKAKLDMIRSGQYPYPFVWSPFILIGR